MGIGRNLLTLTLSVSLVACGGGGSSSGGGAISGGGGGGTPTPTPTSAACSLSAQQDFAKSVLDEWYLFPDKVATNVNKASYSDLQSYIDALVAPSVAPTGGPLQHAGLTYATSIAAENAFFSSGSSAGFGIRLGYDTSSNRVFVVEAFEQAPALAAGIDRGTEILQIGTSANTLQSVATLMATGGPQAVSDALGPSTVGTQRVLVIRQPSGTQQQVTVTKADYSLDPVSNRYGGQIINDGGKKVGYVNLRTFIDSADPDLRAVFDNFRTQGVTEVIVDVRYNGGGLVSIAELFGDLMGRNYAGQVFSRTTLRPSKASMNESRNFAAQPQAITATKIAFIGRSGTASASELVTNAFIPYLNTNMALVGTNTYGKPVGQFAFDLSACDLRVRAIAFKTVNANNQGEYYSGLASVVPVTCRADDDLSHQLGDPAEASVAQALAFLRGGAASCTAISGTPGVQGAQALAPRRELLQPANPSVVQREVPGLY